ncbi:MAG: acetyl-CoA carboxylase, biotin carboxyl carrier protein [Deltaproteobacteria bacterium RBG_13_53_10]|nr:MAG: acetyl-CoA carboxylase, biotin carboxyl carrier protein [Deltaproteobacteria bacterium RBG_13_53_10]
MNLTEDEVLQILKLIEESTFNELHLEMGDLKLTVRKGGSITTQPDERVSKVPAEPRVSKGTEVQQIRTGIQGNGDKTFSLSQEGLTPITSPMLGIFYRCSAPGAPPYVDVGSSVKEDDTVCLIEVMKVFNAVKAGVRGRVEKICAETSQLVEYGQPLFYIRPENPKKNKRKAS